ncbi:hypothetical protein LXL04_032510 [Taraxacum kok-saghyz]
MSSSSSSRTSGPLKIPLKTIQFATSNFSDVSLIKRESSSRKSYEGKIELSGQQIDIVIIVAEKQTEKTFSMEVALLYKLKHRNLVSMVGYCHELDKLTMEKIIVYKNDQRKGSLDNYLTDSALNWMQRLHICVGVARGLSYIYHNKRLDFSVIHRDIKSSKILLDEDWRPILSGFELSMSHKAGRRNVVFHAKFFGSPGYCDPTYFNNKFVSHKSDMYSFGVVLFEGLFEQMDQESFKIFTEVAHHCLEEQQSDRPNIHQIVRKLKKALESQQKHAARLIFEATTSKRLEGKNFEHLKIPLSVIKSATNEFDKTHRIGGGSFGEVYEATLEHIDRKALLSGEEKNISELPKKCSKVAIKLILNREDNEGEDGFYKEVEMLTNCDHLNIVYLLGFCKEDGHMILVYEYAAKGSLDKYLLGSGNLGNLSWVHRIQVCIGIACGLEYLHTKDEERIIHRDIKSGNVLLDENLVAKIGDFGLSKLRPKKYHQVNNTLYTDTLAGTKVYMDPEYLETGNMKNESNIYSFGVVLLEMLSGRFANDAEYIKEDVYGIAPVARRYSREGKIMDLIDHRLTQETHENIFSRDKGPNKKSLDKFVEIAIQCVEITQVQRPSAAVIVERLKSALSFQLMHKDGLQIPFDDIKLGTQDFKDEIGKEQDGKVYKGELCNENGPYLIAAKKMAQDVNENEQNFWMQLQILLDVSGYELMSTNKIFSFSLLFSPRYKWGYLDFSLMKSMDVSLVPITLRCDHGKSGNSSVNVEGQAAKRQKLEEGLLCKVTDTKQQANFIHKALKREGGVDGNKMHITVPRQPELATTQRALRSQRIRQKGDTGNEHVVSRSHGFLDCETSWEIPGNQFPMRGSLDKYLKDNSLTWMKRLEICIGIASGLEVLHGGAGEKEMVVHRHIKSSNILLNDDWIPKITDFGRSYRSPISKDIEYVINKVSRRFSSHDPEDHSYYYNSTKYFDVHSLGVILFEILCGRLWNDYSEIERREYLSLLATDSIKIGKLRLIVCKGIEKQIAPRSLATFQSVALKCINNNRAVQPIGELRAQLEEALELQADFKSPVGEDPDLQIESKKGSSTFGVTTSHSCAKKRNQRGTPMKSVHLRPVFDNGSERYLWVAVVLVDDRFLRMAAEEEEVDDRRYAPIDRVKGDGGVFEDGGAMD